MKKVLSFCIAIIFIFVCSIESFATEVLSLSDFIKVSYKNDDEIMTIDFDSMQKIKNIRMISNEQKIKQLYNTLGVYNIEYSSVYDELIADINYLGGIISTTSYYEFNTETGLSRKISKTECLSKASSNSRSNSNSVSHETVSNNEYMKITTTALAKTNEAVGTYNITTYYEWLRMPTSRKVDAISVASDCITWEMIAANETEDSYSALMISNYSVTDAFSTEQGTYLEMKESPDEMFVDGFYYSFDLLSDSILSSNPVRYTSLSFLVTCKGRVDDYDDGTQMLWVNSKYAHTQIRSIFNLEFGWEIDSNPGVTIVSGSLTEVYYANYLSWDYSDHFNQF